MSYEIQGRTVTMPVEVRRAASWTAQFRIDPAKAQRLLAGTGLDVAILGAKAMASISFVRYIDGDLDAYNEVAFSIMVRRPNTPPAGSVKRTLEFATGSIGVYIHQLPVNQTFTLEAGRTIWGYPKFLSEITIEDDGRNTRCELSHDAKHVLTISIPNGGLVPVPSRVPPTFSLIDGALHETAWTVDWQGGRLRFLQNVRLQLGNHPMSEQIRSLGLPGRAAFTAHVPAMRARFEAPVPVKAGVAAQPRG